MIWAHRFDISTYHQSSYLEKERDVLTKNGCHQVSFGHLTSSLLADQSFKPDLLITTSYTPIDKLVEFPWFKDVKAIIHPNSGYDNFPENILEKLPPIFVGNKIRAQAVAEYNLTAYFHFRGRGRSGNSPGFGNTHQLAWDRKMLVNPLLSNSQSLVIGYGCVGKIVANTLMAMGQKVHIFDPYVNVQGKIREDDLIKFSKLAEMDQVFVCCSLTTENRNFLNKKFFDCLKKDFLIINAARGELIDLPALLSALKNNPQAQAVLDVFPQEPYDLESLKGHPNLHTTSHLAGVHPALEQGVLEFIAAITQDFAKGGLPLALAQHTVLKPVTKV